MSVITSTAPLLIDHDGDICGYDLPKSDPVDIDTKWLRRWGQEDELVYVATWDNGITADLFSLPNEWQAIFLRCSKARRDKLDATLAALAADKLDGPVAAVRAEARAA